MTIGIRWRLAWHTGVRVFGKRATSFYHSVKIPVCWVVSVRAFVRLQDAIICSTPAYRRHVLSPLQAGSSGFGRIIDVDHHVGLRHFRDITAIIIDKIPLT
jgi:hypothetical protein